MDKLTMAHEWAIRNMFNPKYENMTAKDFRKLSFEYADAMQAEADKREKSKDLIDEDSRGEFNQIGVKRLSGQHTFSVNETLMTY